MFSPHGPQKFETNIFTLQLDWQPDQLQWLVDGNVIRTLNRTSTIDSNGVSRYPSTPSRIQLRYYIPFFREVHMLIRIWPAVSGQPASTAPLPALWNGPAA